MPSGAILLAQLTLDALDNLFKIRKCTLKFIQGEIFGVSAKNYIEYE